MNDIINKKIIKKTEELNKNLIMVSLHTKSFNDLRIIGYKHCYLVTCIIKMKGFVIELQNFLYGYILCFLASFIIQQGQSITIIKYT